MTDIAAAKAFVNEAIESLSLECWRGDSLGQMVKVEGPEYTLVIELERIDRALGPRGESMFAPMAEQVKQCVIALYAARAALEGKQETPHVG